MKCPHCHHDIEITFLRYLISWQPSKFTCKKCDKWACLLLIPNLKAGIAVFAYALIAIPVFIKYFEYVKDKFNPGPEIVVYMLGLFIVLWPGWKMIITKFSILTKRHWFWGKIR